MIALLLHEPSLFFYQLHHTLLERGEKFVLKHNNDPFFHLLVIGSGEKMGVTSVEFFAAKGFQGFPLLVATY